MRIRRPLAVSALAAIVFLLPSCTLGAIKAASFGDARLGLQGASVVVPLHVTCAKGWNIAFGDANVAQADPPRLAQGFGSFENEFPGVPCTGSEQTVSIAVFNTSPWVFKTGDAVVRGDITVFNPVTGELPTKIIDDREIEIRRSDPQPNPVRAAQTAPDARFLARR